MNIKPEPFTLTKENMYMAGISRSQCLTGGDIVVPEAFEHEGTVYRITEIGRGTFADYRNITGITLPDSIRTIGDCAFLGCYSLESITIPDGVTSIGASAFSGCTSLKSAIIPDTVASIGMYAFNGCRSMETVTLPDSIMEIRHRTFQNCQSLKEITIPDGVTDIRDYAFADCYSLIKVTVPDSVERIWNQAFLSCGSLADIVVPELASVSTDAFLGCPHLAKKDWTITIANSETSDTVIMHFNGTKEEVRKALFLLAAEDRANDPDGYDYGANSLDDLEQTEDGLRFATSVCYSDYHIDYTAVEDSRVEELSRDILYREMPSFEKEQDRGMEPAAGVEDKRFAELKKELFMDGPDAIANFLGFDYNPEWDDDTIENAMDDAYAQMPDEELEEFYVEYNIQEPDEGIDR